MSVARIKRMECNQSMSGDTVEHERKASMMSKKRFMEMTGSLRS